MNENLTKFNSALKALLPESIHALCNTTSFKKGTLLFETGKKPHWMFFVVSGEVTLERLSHQGDPLVLQRTRHGFVSEASLQSSQYHCDGRVVANSEIVQIPLKSLADALNKDPKFAGRWISMLNSEVIFDISVFEEGNNRFIQTVFKRLETCFTELPTTDSCSFYSECGFYKV